MGVTRIYKSQELESCEIKVKYRVRKKNKITVSYKKKYQVKQTHLKGCLAILIHFLGTSVLL